MPDEYEAEACITFGDGYDGVGWYYWDAEYPEEGSCGAFATRDEAEKDAREGEYTVFHYVTLAPKEKTDG